MATIPTTQNIPRANLGNFRDPGTIAPQTPPDVMGELGKAGFDFAKAITIGNDQAVATRAFYETTDNLRNWSQLEGPYGKTPSELYAQNQSPLAIKDDFNSHVDRIGNEGAAKLTNANQRALFNKLWASRADQEKTSGLKHIVSSHQKFQTEVGKSFMDSQSARVGELAAGVESDWRGWAGAAAAAATGAEAGLALGVPAHMIVDQKRAAADTITRSAIKGWFNEQPDKLFAVDSLINGTIEDPDAKMLWGSLGPKDREGLVDRLLTEHSKLTTLQNARRDEGRKEMKIAADYAMKQFFSKDTKPEERAEIIDRLRASEFVSQEMVHKMDQFHRNGGNLGEDVQKDVLTMEAEVRHGRITSDTQALEYMAKNDLQVSIETMRTRVVPLIEANRDDAFKTAMTRMMANVGAAPVGMIQMPGDDPVAVKAARASAQLLQFRRLNPEGDFEAEADRIAARIQKDTSAGSLNLLPILRQQYEAALASKNATAIANARTVLIATMMEAGLVTGLEAQSPSYNPLQTLDKAGQPNGQK